MTDATKILRDAAYITIGAGVLAVQKVQVQRQELKKQLESGIDEAREGFTSLSDTVEVRLKDVEQRLGDVQSQVEERFQSFQSQVEQATGRVEANVEKYLDEIESRLPEQARELVAQARTAAREAQDQLRQLVKV